jgi:hypothetical protein
MREADRDGDLEDGQGENVDEYGVEVKVFRTVDDLICGYEPEKHGNLLYFGYDVARVRDAAEIFVIGLLPDGKKISVANIEMVGQSFEYQRDQIRKLMRSNLPVERGCIDKTGMGMDTTETLQREFTEAKIEGVYFYPQSKDILARGVKEGLEKREFLLQNDNRFHRQIHSIKRIPMPGGAFRYDSERDEMGHADKFWALALANHAIPRGTAAKGFYQQYREKRRGEIQSVVQDGVVSRGKTAGQLIRKVGKLVGGYMASRIIGSENVDMDAMIRKVSQLDMKRRKANAISGAVYSSEKKMNDDVKSFFFDPLHLEQNYFGGVKTISPYHNRRLAPRILRHVSERAWIINLCIITSIRQARPYFKESTSENQRGFRIKHKKSIEAGREMNDGEKKEARRLVDFLMNTGDADDPSRTDDLDKYMTKIIRDIYQLDQISTELQWSRCGKELRAFWAIDTATIEIALPSTMRETGISFAQVINHVPHAFYTKDELLFDCINPRTDIERAGYGYSIVEQAVDLITSSVNTFTYNASIFTENKLPRGMLLLNAPADQDEIEDIEDYLTNLLSGTPASQWRIPIVPTGRAKNSDGGGKVFEWVKFQESNKDMEFQNWFDLQLSGIAAMFSKSLEELGLHSSKSQPLQGTSHVGTMQEASKSLGLGDLLSFLQKHSNKIVQYKNPDFSFEFIGYEKDNLKLVSDIDKAEVDTWKTLNEKRLEKGFELIDLTKVDNPADLPMSPQVVQLWQGSKMGGGMDGGDFDMGEEASEDSQDSESGEDGNDDEWGASESQLDGTAVNKSMTGHRHKVVKIII